jgi:hypothetical protein
VGGDVGSIAEYDTTFMIWEREDNVEKMT